MKSILWNKITRSVMSTKEGGDGTNESKAVLAFERWIETGGYLKARIKLDSVAHEIGLTSQELRQICTKHYGCSFNQKIKMLRIEQACRIISSHPETPIASIGAMVGIEDRSNFRKEFKSITGLYPQEWKKK